MPDDLIAPLQRMGAYLVIGVVVILFAVQFSHAQVFLA